MRASFRLGIVGAGRMGMNHVRALRGSTLVTVVAVADRSPAARDAVARGCGVPVYEDMEAMLDRARPDGVLIAAPTDQHLRLIGELVARRLPMLCEKPGGIDADGLRAAAAAADAAGVPLQVAYWRRHVPALQALRRRIEFGQFGALQLVGCHQFDQRPPAAAFRNSSGGIMVDMGVHEFDQLRWLTRQEVDELSATAAGRGSDPGVTDDVDTAQAIARLSGSACGFVAVGRHFPGGDSVRVEVYGSADVAHVQILAPGSEDAVLLDALLRQGEAFRAHAAGDPGAGATAADAVAALVLAERAARLLDDARVAR